MKPRLLLTLLGSFLFLSLVTAGEAQWPAKVNVVSPTPGSSVHSLLSLMEKPVVQYTPIERWDVQPLGGPEVWLPMMKEGKCHFASHSVPDMLKAYQGRGAYEKLGATPVRTVAAGHSHMFMFWTTAESRILDIRDLKGKKVFLRYKNNPLFIEMAQNQLTSAGLKLSDLKSVLPFSNLSVATKALVEGMADAILFPAAREAVEEINRLKGECRFVPLTLDQSRYVVERLPGYHVEDIPGDDPRFGNRSPVQNAVCYQTALFCSPSLPAEVVYGVVKAVFDNSDELSGGHPLAAFWSLNYRPIALAVPYHEGAIRYFREKGLWTREAQGYQERVLKR